MFVCNLQSLNYISLCRGYDEPNFCGGGGGFEICKLGLKRSNHQRRNLTTVADQAFCILSCCIPSRGHHASAIYELSPQRHHQCPVLFCRDGSGVEYLQLFNQQQKYRNPIDLLYIPDFILKLYVFMRVISLTTIKIVPSLARAIII